MCPELAGGFVTQYRLPSFITVKLLLSTALFSHLNIVERKSGKTIRTKSSQFCHSQMNNIFSIIFGGLTLLIRIDKSLRVWVKREVFKAVIHCCHLRWRTDWGFWVMADCNPSPAASESKLNGVGGTGMRSHKPCWQSQHSPYCTALPHGGLCVWQWSWKLLTCQH